MIRQLVLHTSMTVLGFSGTVITAKGISSAYDYTASVIHSRYKRLEASTAKKLGYVAPLPATPRKTRAQMVTEAATLWKVNEGLIWSVIEQESKGELSAFSSAGAIGLMQIMPANAAFCETTPVQLLDEETNINCGTKMLSHELENFKGNATHALRAYYIGSTCLRKVLKGTPEPECNRQKKQSPDYASEVLEKWARKVG